VAAVLVASNPATADYVYYEEDDNFSDNPLAQSSSANQAPVAATSAQTAIRSSNTFSLNPDDLFEEEADYAEEEDEDDDDEDEDEEAAAMGQQLVNNIISNGSNAISRQSSSADVTASLASNAAVPGQAAQAAPVSAAVTGSVTPAETLTSITASDLAQIVQQSNIEYFQVGRDDEDEDEDEDEDDEYGDDFNDNFVVDYENVDRRTLIKELVNASNALASRPASGNTPGYVFVFILYLTETPCPD